MNSVNFPQVKNQLIELANLTQKYRGVWQLLAEASEIISDISTRCEITREETFEIIQTANHLGCFTILPDNKQKFH